jgi:hypothetical protein
LDPDHLEPSGKLAVAAIALEDIRFRGWSVDRQRFTSKWRVRLSHYGWKKRKPKLIKLHVLPLRASDIRLVAITNGQQEFVVTDSAVWLNPAHSAVLLAGPKGEGAARGLRSKLMEGFPQYMDVEQAFNSADKFGFLKGTAKQFASILFSSVHYIFRSRA